MTRGTNTAPAAAAPADFPDSPLSRLLAQPVSLGLFLPIQAGGWSASTLPRTTDWSFDYNVALARKAEALGFDLLFALSQWLPKGGKGGVFTDDYLDSFMATAALTSVTEKILLISTIHVLYGPIHPLHLAKYGATLDHISKGRWGINVVTGDKPVQHAMFGRPFIEHDERYRLADEFVTVLKKLWSSTENISFEGISPWRIEDAYVSPKPHYGRPVLVVATGSDAGVDFAARHADLIFVASPKGAFIDDALASLPDHTARIKARASSSGRDIRTLINPLVVSRETEAETLAYRDAIIAHWDADADMDRFSGDGHARRGHSDRGLPARKAIGGNVQVIGTPEQVVEQFVALRRTGIDGFHLSFYDFAPDLEFFGDHILPLMKQAGLRL